MKANRSLWLLAAGVIAGTSFAMAIDQIEPQASAQQVAALAAAAAPPEMPRRVPTSNTELMLSYAPLVKASVPAVVNVYTARVNRTRRDPFWDLFFGGGRMTPQPRVEQSLGSGVIVDGTGLIVTNNHVVEGADEIKVALADRREFPAKLMFTDKQLDLALLKVETGGTALPVVPLGDSDSAEVGDVVIAIGNPFGVGQTVTMGIVGGLGRAVPGAAGALEYEDFIQTDAAINPGNSGGALIDVEGRLVGINTAIVSRGGGNNGVGFAVPVNLARTVMESLVEHGRVVRGFLGVNIQDVTPSLAAEFGLQEPTGALVAEVTPKGPADKAGLKSGDVVTKFDGRDVRDSRHLKVMVGQTPPSREVRIELLRDGKKREMEIALKERDADQELSSNRRGGSRSEGDVGGLQGVVVGDLTDPVRQRLEIPENVTGALVTQLDPESRAAESGLRQGDVIREINRRPVKDAESAIDAVQGLENARILLKVWRQGGTLFVVVDETHG